MDPLNNIGRFFAFFWSSDRKYKIIGRIGDQYRIVNVETGNILRLGVNTVLTNGNYLY